METLNQRKKKKNRNRHDENKSDVLCSTGHSTLSGARLPESGEWKVHRFNARSTRRQSIHFQCVCMSAAMRSIVPSFLSTIGIVVVSSFRISILLNSPDTMPFNQETQFSHRRFYCMRRSQSTIGSFHRSIHVRSQTRLQYRGDNLVLKVKVKMCSHCLHMCRK